MAYFTYSNWTSLSSVMIRFDIDMARHIVCELQKYTVNAWYCPRGSNSDKVYFCFFRRARLQRPPKVGNYPSASETPFKWRFASEPIIAQRWMLTWQLCDFHGIRTSITKKPYKFVIFQGGGFEPPAPPLWIRTCNVKCCHTYLIYVIRNVLYLLIGRVHIQVQGCWENLFSFAFHFKLKSPLAKGGVTGSALIEYIPQNGNYL